MPVLVAVPAAGLVRAIALATQVLSLVSHAGVPSPQFALTMHGHALDPPSAVASLPRVTRLLIVALGLFVGCSPMYGRESCTTDPQCKTGGQICANSCSLPDAGPGKTVSWLCQKVCDTDADCANLGLKKPSCTTNLCASGSRTCVDLPF